MQERDIYTKRYLSDNIRFADLLNTVIFIGNQVVKAGDLQEMDGTLWGSSAKGGKKNAVARYRDMVRKAAFGMNFVVIGIENQSEVHYGMPLRVMQEDSMEYDRQYQKVVRSHRSAKDLTKAEFLSGFSRADKLSPVITIVLYYGECLWDGPRSIYDMVRWRDLPEPLHKLVQNYSINLLEVRRFTNIQYFHTDLKIVFGFLQNAMDKKQLKKYLLQNKEEFSELEEDAFDVICAIADIRGIQRKLMNQKGEIDMCQAIEEMILDGKQEGKQEAMTQIVRNMRQNGLSDCIICEYAGLTKKELKLISEVLLKQ